MTAMKSLIPWPALWKPSQSMAWMEWGDAIRILVNEAMKVERKRGPGSSALPTLRGAKGTRQRL